ncbi:MAG: mechanosensitive ion channel family protein [bacterium]
MFKDILEYKLIEVAEYKVTVGNLVIIAAIIVGTWVGLTLVRKILYRSRKLDQGQKYSVFQIVRYVVWVVAIAYCLESLGVEFTLLLAGSAALMVGLGLGLQQTFNDFVSGVIILVEGTIKVGDIIEVDGIVSRVKHIGLRTTKVISRDDITLILPNNILTNHQVINWSHAQETARFKVSVGVDYSSDIELVTKILLDCVSNHKAVLKKPKPFVRFEDFGNSSLDFSIFFWSDKIFPIENVKSEIRYAINKGFRENKVTIPFPQRVVHMPKENE